MKKLFFVLAIAAITTSVNAQSKSTADAKPLSFSVGLEAALPIGDLGDLSSFGVGGSVQVNYNVASSLAITGNVGYVTYLGKTLDVSGYSYKYPSLGYVPILAGIEYSFTPMVFGSAQIGYAVGVSPSGLKGGLEYAPGVGVKFSQFSALVKYTGISQTGGSLSSVGLRLAYSF
jgi:hypothetical protein